MQAQNIYYKDLIEGNILRRLEIRPMQANAFRNYMKQIGKLGGQIKSQDCQMIEKSPIFCLRW